MERALPAERMVALTRTTKRARTSVSSGRRRGSTLSCRKAYVSQVPLPNLCSSRPNANIREEAPWGKGNDKDRYVVKRPDGRAVVKEDHERASAVTHTQQEAIDRAKRITHNLGGGEIRVQNRHGQFREGDRER
jgi:hypothetical protein